MSQEVTNSLLLGKDLKIIQRKDMFNYSIDTILVAMFASLTKNMKHILDIGTNNGAIPIILSTRTHCKITGVEIQEVACHLAIRNIEANKLTDQIKIVHERIQNYSLGNNEDRYQLIICNPPFFKKEEKSKLKESVYMQIARHEIELSLEEVVMHAARLLANQGKFVMIHRQDRLVEIIETLKKYDIEPKRLRFVYPKVGKQSHMLLIEGIYKGNLGGLIIEAPLYLHKEDGSYTDEVLTYYSGGCYENTK